MLALALTVSGAAHALDPAIRLEDYNLAAWTAQDGAPNEIRTMAQTPDGWLWLGATAGLFRFDGTRFERYAISTEGAFAKRRISELRSDSAGNLWIGYSVGGLSVLRKNGNMEEVLPLDSPAGIVTTLAVDSDGALWIAGGDGLYLHQQGRLRKFGAAQGLPAEIPRSVLLDQYGQLWTSNRQGLYRLNRADGKFEQVIARKNDAGLIQSPDGRLWMVDKQQAEAVPRQAPAQTGILPRSIGFNSAEARWTGQFDRDGNLWTPHCPQGLCVIARGGQAPNTLLIQGRDAGDRGQQQSPAAPGASNAIMEDREGNIWIATQSGLRRYRENRLIAVPLPGSSGLFSMAGDTEGGVWATNMETKTAWRLSAAAAPVADTSQAFSVLAQGRDGALLLAGARHIERRYKGRVSQIALPPGRDGKPAGLDVVGMQDDGKVLWIATMQLGLLGLVDGRWLPRGAFSLPPRIFLATAGGHPGERWQATTDGMIYFNDSGKLTAHDARAIGLATSITVGDDVVAGGDQGLAILQQGRFRTLTAAQPEVLFNISGMAVTANGDRWFNGGKGVVQVRRADWRAAVDLPGMPLRYTLLDRHDGYPGQPMLENRLSSAYVDQDDGLWFMTSGGIVRLSPGRVGRNQIVPTAQVLRVAVGDASHPARAGLRLPPGSNNLAIHFTAPMLARPEATRFEYQLSGVDDDWREAGGRRDAGYTNVAPGSYTFRVRAYNEDGVASAEDAVLAFEIAPTLVQTTWFKTLCGLAAAVLLYLLYQYRLRRETGRVAERMHARMAERERIARTLHDTFLQSVQAIVLRLDVVSAALPEDSDTRKKLDPLLDQANDTLVEGRDQVHELRTGRVDDVENAAREAGRRLEQEHSGTGHSVAVSGARTKLRIGVAEEACEIVREAMRNAFQHAGATRIGVRLSFQREQFVLRIEDDGRGMAPDAEHKLRHYGLIGMRERAARAGGKLVIDSMPGEGVSVALTVPARLAYASGRRWWSRE